MAPLAPALGRLLHATECYADGSATADAVRVSLIDAQAHVGEGRRLLAEAGAGIVRTGEVERLLQDADEGVRAQEGCLAALEQALDRDDAGAAREVGEKLEAASTRLLKTYDALRGIEQQSAQYAPYPAVDQFIKAGINFLEGRVNAEALQIRFGDVVSTCTGLLADLSRVGELFDVADLLREAANPRSHVEAGLGAVATWMQSGRRGALEDGLKLLGSGCQGLHLLSEKLDAAVRAQAKHSPFRPLEELRRAAEREAAGTARRPLVAECWIVVEEAWSRLQGAMLSATALPLPSVRDEAWDAVREDLHDARLLLDRLGPEVREGRVAADFPWGELEELFKRLTERMSARWAALEADASSLSRMPRVQELRDVVERVRAGEAPRDSLRRTVASFRAAAQAIWETGPDAQVAALLQSQEAGLARLETYVASQVPDDLEAGWQEVEESARALSRVAESMREHLGAAATGSRRTTSCMRCGADNPTGRRFCQSCGAVLPVVADGPVEYDEIGPGGQVEVPMAPANLLKLEEIVGKAEGGSLGPEAVVAELDQMLAGLEEVRQEFERFASSPAGSDAALAPVLEEFGRAVETYSTSLLTMRLLAGSGGTQHMRTPLETCREAAEDLVALKGRLGR